VRRDCRAGLLVVVAQEFEGAVGEHDAEAEGGVRRVLLDDGDVDASIAALDQRGEIEAGRTGAEDGDAHGVILSAGMPRESGTSSITDAPATLCCGVWIARLRGR